MQRSFRMTVAVAAVVAAIAVPTIAFGNARRDQGTLSALHFAETPFVARLLGANEVPVQGDPDGLGAASISFDFISDTEAEVCWDLTYANITTGTEVPTNAHIHAGVAGAAGDPVVTLGPTFGTSGASGCRANVSAALADQIIANPAAYYVNIHTAAYGGGAIRGQLAKGPAPSGSTHMLPTPLRAYDSRDTGQTKLASLATRTVSLATGKLGNGTVELAVPPGATAAIVTLTATETDGASYLKMYSAASTEPATSNVNWTTAGATIAVSTTVAVDSSGNVKVTAGPRGTHFLIDVVGYLY